MILGLNPADFSVGSPQSRAAARALAATRTALSQYDEDCLTIWSNVSALYSPRCGWQAKPNSWDLEGNPVYARGWELYQKHHPIIPAHLDEHLKRWTRESGEFERAFGREPKCGDILRYEQVALINDSRLIEIRCHVFTEAWNRQLPELHCPKKFEGGRLFIRSVHHIPGSGVEEAWVEDTRVTPQAIWRDIISYLQDDLEVKVDAETVRGLTFLGVGPRKLCGGIVENNHRCRPSTLEELQRPDPEPIGGLLKALKNLGVNLNTDVGQCYRKMRCTK